MEHSDLNPFVPNISLFRFPNAVFELRIHLHLPYSPFFSAESPLAKADVELTPHGDYLIVSGNVHSCVRVGAEKHAYAYAHGDSVRLHPDAYGTLLWTDQPCGRFGRDVRLGLSPGTEYVVIDRRVEYGDYVVRYVVRNKMDYAMDGGCYAPAGAGVHQTGIVFDHHRYYHHHNPGVYHPHYPTTGFPFPPSHFPHTTPGVTVLPGGGLSGGAGYIHVRDSAQNMQTFGVNQSLSTETHQCAVKSEESHLSASGGARVRFTEYEGEQRNVSTEGHCTEISKSAEINIGKVHADIGVTVSESVQTQGQSDVSIAQYGAGGAGEVLGVTVLAGGEDFRRSESVRKVGESSMEQGQVVRTSTAKTTQTTAELEIGRSASHGSCEVQDGGIVESATSQVVRESEQEFRETTQVTTEGKASGRVTLSASSTQGLQTSTEHKGVIQTSTEETTQTPTQQTMAASAAVITESIGGAVTFAQSAGQYGSQVVGEAHGTAILPSREIIRESVTSGIAEEIIRKEEMTQTSTQQTIAGSTAVITGSIGGAVTFAKSAGQYESQVIGEAHGTAILPSREIIRESVTSGIAGEIIRKEELTQMSTQETSQTSASTEQIMQSSTEMEVGASISRGTITGSTGQYGGRVEGGVLDVTILPGRGSVRESVTGVVVGESTRDIVQTSTQNVVQSSTQDIVQSSTQATTQMSAEVGVEKSGNRVTFVETTSQDSEQVARGVLDGTAISRGKSILVSGSEQLVQGSTQELRSSTQETTQMSTTQQIVQSSTEVGVAESTDSRVIVARSTGEHGGRVTGNELEVTVLSGGGRSVRESTQGTVQTSTELSTQTSTESLTTQTSTLETTEASTQRTIQNNAELEIGESTSRVTSVGSAGHYGGQIGGEVLDVTILPGGQNIQGAVVGETVQETESAEAYVSSSKEVAQTSTQQVSVEASTLTGVAGSERYGREQALDVVSSSVQNVSSSRMQETVHGTTAEAVAIENKTVSATFDTSEAAGLNVISSGAITVAPTGERNLNVTSITAGERLDYRVTSGGDIQGATTTFIAAEVGNSSTAQNAEQDYFATEQAGQDTAEFSAEVVRRRVSSESRSTSSARSDNWHVVSRSASSTLVPTLHTLASAEQIQATSAEQTRTVSFERNLSDVSAELIHRVSAESDGASD